MIVTSKTLGSQTLLLDSDIEELLSTRYVGLTKTPAGAYYASVLEKFAGKWYSIPLHRLINGTPYGLLTDHINGNTLDNRRQNLRTVTYSQNSFNRNIHRNGKIPGVEKRIKRYIKKDGTISVYTFWRVKTRLLDLGYFKTGKQAKKAFMDLSALSVPTRT